MGEGAAAGAGDDADVGADAGEGLSVGELVALTRAACDACSGPDDGEFMSVYDPGRRTFRDPQGLLWLEVHHIGWGGSSRGYARSSDGARLAWYESGEPAAEVAASTQAVAPAQSATGPSYPQTSVTAGPRTVRPASSAPVPARSTWRTIWKWLSRPLW